MYVDKPTKGKQLIKTSESHPINVDFVTVPEQPSVRFGMTFCPGKAQMDALTGSWFRDLRMDLLRIRDVFNIQRLVCCLEQHELEMLRVESLETRCFKSGIELFFIPIPDGGTPNSEAISKLHQALPRLLESTQNNGFTAIFCKGGLGRTGLITAALLKEYGVKTSDAINMVRRARPGTVENREQELFVETYVSSDIRTKLPRPECYNPHQYTSGHTWRDEEDSLTFDQLKLNLKLRLHDEFLLPLGLNSADINVNFLEQQFAAVYLIEKLYKQSPNLAQHLELPLPVRIGQYRKAVHAICATLLKSRSESKGFAIICPGDASYNYGNESKTSDRFLAMKDQLSRANLLLGEGRRTLPIENISNSPNNKIILAGPITEDEAIVLMNELRLSFFVFAGTLSLVKIVISNR